MGNNSGTRTAQREAMLDARKAKVASYKVQGFSIRQTAAALAKDKLVNPDTGKPWSIKAIHDDLAALTSEWKASALRDITEVKAAELAKLDELEREAWIAWRRGIGRKQTRTTKSVKVGKGDAVLALPETTLRTEHLNGDPRYLGIVLDCQQRRAKILGLDAPTKLEHGGKISLEQLITGEGLEDE